MNIIRVNI